MIFFFAVLSVNEIACLTSLARPDFFARLVAISSSVVIFLFTTAFLFELLSALLAVFVTGILNY